MKFGKSIGSQQDGNLELHYVDYKLLKKRIKDTIEQLKEYEVDQALQANSLFEKELESEIELVNECFAKRQSELLQEAASLSEDVHQRQSHCLATEASSSSAAACPSVATKEQRPDSFRQLVEILGEVDQLRKYAVWNAVAVVKILKKRRKQTHFGLEDTATERAAWLSRQSFFSGSDFAELHATIESLGDVLVISELQLGGVGTTHKPQLPPVQEAEQCPICLETISDMVELSCNHRFCWKCFVLGPIAFQPGEYRITQCPLCRMDTCNPIDGEGGVGAGIVGGVPSAEGLLTRFLHTYFPKEGLTSVNREEDGDFEARNAVDEREMREVVDTLVKALLVDSTMQSPTKDAGDGSSLQLGRCKETTGAVSSDFFQTLPPQPTEKNLIGAAQKLQWLQLASTGDSFALDGTMYCSLCSDPLLMEVVVTTPCKHHFHRICIGRLEEPKCPLCNSQLPFDWFLPADHPCSQSGFSVVPIHKYKPLFPGGPSRGTGGFPLHQPPPVSLLGPAGITMKSYLHKMLPVDVDDDVGGACAADSPSAPTSPELRPHPAEDLAESSASDSSSEDSCSEDGAYRHDEHYRSQRSKPHVWACSAVGKIRLLEQRDEPQATERLASNGKS